MWALPPFLFYVSFAFPLLPSSTTPLFLPHPAAPHPTSQSGKGKGQKGEVTIRNQARLHHLHNMLSTRHPQMPKKSHFHRPLGAQSAHPCAQQKHTPLSQHLLEGVPFAKGNKGNKGNTIFMLPLCYL